MKSEGLKMEVSGIKPEKLPLYRIWRTQFEISGTPLRQNHHYNCNTYQPDNTRRGVCYLLRGKRVQIRNIYGGTC